MMKPPEQGWGSCPVDGRDWGTTESCNEAIIKMLFQRFQSAQSAAGKFSYGCRFFLQH